MAQRSRQTIPLGEQLCFWRTHAKWSRRQLAERAGVSISTVQHLKLGRGTLTYYTLLLRALRLKLHARDLGEDHRLVRRRHQWHPEFLREHRPRA
jgi:transcriptional regulator with XRE-family HTH domain